MNKHDEPEKRNLLLYLLVAFVWTWIFWLSLFVLSKSPLENLSAMLLFIGGFGPFIAAVSVTYFTEGKDAVRRLAKKGINYRFKKNLVHSDFPVFSRSKRTYLPSRSDDWIHA